MYLKWTQWLHVTTTQQSTANSAYCPCVMSQVELVIVLHFERVPTSWALLVLLYCLLEAQVTENMAALCGDQHPSRP